ncbi:MAG TPA: hypothetical protein PLS40_11515 [Bacteroidia bacterium]|jgi:hypothetical protein|nr:hypothetical protein [Bacteroidia bacterium]
MNTAMDNCEATDEAISAYQNVSANSEEIANAARDSLDFLAALAVPQVYKYAFPDVLLSAWDFLVQQVSRVREFPQLALGIPRGFAKTLVIKLFILYTILFTQKRFILVVCENSNKAKNIIADVADMLSEPNIKAVFGDWTVGSETDTQALKKFGFRGRNIILAGLGVESGIRGITLKNERPDIIIFDDIQSRKCAESQIQSEDLEKEMYGTVMKAKSPHGCLFVFVANMYPTKWSILRKLKTNPNWLKFIVGGILADGTSLWEDLQPIAQLHKEFLNDLSSGHPETFFAEVLNDENASSHNLIDLSLLPPCKHAEGDIPAGNFVIIDPSGDTVASDAVAIGYFEVFDGYPTLRKLKNDKLSPGETIREALRLCLENNCRLVAIESVAYQASLKYWFEFVCAQLGIIGIQAVEVYPGGFSKNSRILSMLKAYAAGEIFVDDSCKVEVHLQITQFNPLKTKNVDDILDLLCYAPKVLELYGEYITNMCIIEQQEFAATVVPDFNSPF